jgi:LacI family transcriptional regulator
MQGKRQFSLSPAAPRRRVLLALGYYDQQLHRGTARYARKAGWILDTHMAHHGVLPSHWQGDGILTLLFPQRTDLTEYVCASRAAVVDLTHDVNLALPRVLLDNEKIGQLAAGHLIERGFENLAFLKFSDASDIRERASGFAGAVRKARRKPLLLDWHAFSQTALGRDADWMEWLVGELHALPKPIGILAQSDSKGVALLNACEAAGLRVPEQVAVVGVDNDELACEFAPVPLSSVDSQRDELAYAGAALLDRLMAGLPAPAVAQRIAPNCVIVRESSDILAVNHVQVAAALRFIWQHYRDPITVKHVVDACPMSRCGLYGAFEKHVGRTLAEEIARKRVEHARKLLAGTGEKMSSVALLSGFSSGEHLSRAFTRLTGQTPSQYRRAHAG